MNTSAGVPIGHQTQNPSDGFDKGHSGEDGAGVGVSGGHVGHDARQSATFGSGGFNAGLGGEHASGGLPGISHGQGAHPIADKYMGQLGGSEPVSGAYSGGGISNALTGESHATRTGAGVGPLGENLSGSTHIHPSQHHGHTHQTGAALAGTAGGAAAASGLGQGVTGHHQHQQQHQHQHHDSSSTGVGVGAVGGSGGHYNPVEANMSESTRTSGGLQDPHHGTHGHAAGIGAATGGAAAAAATTAAIHHHQGQQHQGQGHGQTSNANQFAGPGASAGGIYEAQQAGARGTHGSSGITGKDVAAGGAGVGLGAAGAGAAGAGAAAGSKSSSSDDTNERGAPVSDPKDIDSGGRHGLVFQESTGTYVHRRELEEKK